ncbi:hypothetical protein EJ05DRAFT_393741 [Pseudovirgaria hyperparasitica]|uniref:FHA domain-containing protein n=1 Tax=Pseudovirgaria hyperparasitica TaxID=470096 RepID=A0A6A6W5V5_9PEZI|nr:uncharacterized protein EJ05DRAFT_393741 [Pseudovirgaria hyperparasitica]KAF2757549.1 hypothetical protein EJ05DRAFT_393741 [Pseudovirgaria hyperparasitica]
MTAVAPPPNFQPISRTGWSASNNSNGVNPDDVSRMFMPPGGTRRGVQRTPSSSSISSTASNGTITSTSLTTNGISQSPATEGQNWTAKKKPTRGLWPASEAKPVAGLSTARPQPIASASSGPSAASAMNALHSPSPHMLPSQTNGQSQVQTNGQPRTSLQPENTAVLYLIPMNGTFERKTITVPFFPEVLKIGRQTNQKTQPTPLNGYFDSKVLSRQHAEIWAERTGKVWIRDVKSSNGTFVNGQRLSPENRDSEPQELREQDMLELGIDIVSEDQKTIVHHKVAARVEHAGFYNTNGQNMLDLNFGDLDSPNANGLMGAGFGQNMGPMRSRQGSQGTIGSARLGSAANSMANNNMGAMGQQRQNTFWLQPISMEQVVKKLNAELKLAKQQTQDLQRASHSIETMLTTEPKKEAIKSPQASHNPLMKPSPVKGDIKARFSDPPAPPPQQPLPEKPDAASYIPSFRRTDTEKPKSSNSSPSRSGRFENFSPISSLVDPQSAALAEALAAAKKDLEAQNIKLKELEQIIEQEKRAREAAEEKALRLEAEQRKELLSQHGSVATSEIPVRIADDAQDDETLVDTESAKASMSSSPIEPIDHTDALQKRLDSMVIEMSEVRQQMERYRQRAEAAEAESTRDRDTLAEMVDKLRDQQKSKGGVMMKRLRKTQSSSKEKTESGEANGHVAGTTPASEVQRAEELAQEFSEALQQLMAQDSRRDEIMVHKAPVASMVSIVLIGVGLMAWLNSWPKIER